MSFLNYVSEREAEIRKSIKSREVIVNAAIFNISQKNKLTTHRVKILSIHD